MGTTGYLLIESRDPCESADTGDDAVERGPRRDEITSDARAIGCSGLAELFGGYDQIWHW